MRGEDVVAEEPVIDGHDPVGKRRLFEIADAVDIERDPVAAECNVFGDLRVGGVGVVEQGWSKQRRHIDGQEDGGQQNPRPQGGELGQAHLRGRGLAAGDGKAAVGEISGFPHGRRVFRFRENISLAEVARRRAMRQPGSAMAEWSGCRMQSGRAGGSHRQ